MFQSQTPTVLVIENVFYHDFNPAAHMSLGAVHGTVIGTYVGSALVAMEFIPANLAEGLVLGAELEAADRYYAADLG